jgi:hypothetical protein
MSKRRNVNSILKNFIAHAREFRESPAWGALPDNARRVLDRLELEHMRHGGSENGKLPVTYSDFVKAGIRRASVSLAIRQCEKLGFVEITKRGGRSISDVRCPSHYRLTYVFGRSNSIPSDEWKRIKTDEEAREALRAAAPEPQKAGRENGTGAGRENGTRAGRESGTPTLGAKAELLTTSMGMGSKYA